MGRDYYVNLAKSNASFPIGADLVLREHLHSEEILEDGARLGQIVAESALRFKTPLAMPVMDLMLEKKNMLRFLLDGNEREITKWHFTSCPSDQQIALIRKGINSPFDRRLQANIEAIRYVADHTTLVPVGMSIGPFSLMTKMLSDPITPVFMAGTGLTSEDDDDVKMIETLMELCTEMVLRSFKEQARAGAKAFFIAEPAANKVFISPNQMANGSDVFERLVLSHLRRIKAVMNEANIDLIFHCCGELTEEMVRGFNSLRPTMISFGSSRNLWEDAALIDKDIVLYGNLPSKKFFSDELISVQDVRETGRELQKKMAEADHPFILGTECDVLHVNGCEKQLMEKAMAIVHLSDEQRSLIRAA
jgi:uroporphyrinogen-III decarboxylase